MDDIILNALYRQCIKSILHDKIAVLNSLLIKIRSIKFTEYFDRIIVLVVLYSLKNPLHTSLEKCQLQ